MIGSRKNGAGRCRTRRVGIAVSLVAAALLIGHGAWIHGKGWLGQQLMARAWSEAREKGRPPEAPWPGARTRPVARLVIPDLQIDRLVLDGVDLPNLAWGPGMTEGPRGHRIIAGHRDTHFRFLGDLSPGHRIRLESLEGEPLDWEVVERSIVDSRTTAIDLEAAGPMLTLLTCYPLGGSNPGTPFRLVLAARPVKRPIDPGPGFEVHAAGRETLAWAR